MDKKLLKIQVNFLFIVNKIEKNLFKFCNYLFDNIIISHSAIISDISKILQNLKKEEIQIFLPNLKSKLELESFLKLKIEKNTFNLLNFGFKKIIQEHLDIDLCDVCIYDIPNETQFILDIGFDKIPFRNIIWHQIDSITNLFRIPYKINNINIVNECI